MPNNTLPLNPTVDQEVEWYKAELGTWDNLDMAWSPEFKAEFKRLSGQAIENIILGSGEHGNLDVGPDAFGMAGAYQRLITTEQLSAMSAVMIEIIYPSIVLSTDIDFSKLGYLHTYMLASKLNTSLAADDPQAVWVSKITLEQVSKLNTADGYTCQANLYNFWTNPKNLSTNADLALPYLESLREKLQTIGRRAIASAMGYYYDKGEQFADTNIDPRVSQLLTTKQTNDSFGYFRSSPVGKKRWLDQNFKDIATLKRKDVVIKDLSALVVNAMAVELERTSQVNGEFGHWVWGLSDQQIQGLSKDAGLALFKAWLSGYAGDTTYSPADVVNDTLARQVKNFSSDVIEAIINTNFGLAAKYQWLLTAEQVNGLSFDSLSQIFGTIAQRTDLTSGLSQRVVNDMAIMLDQRGQVNGQLGYWVWTLSDRQVKDLSPEAGLALFKAWLSHYAGDETYSPNHVVNDTLARQFKNFNSVVIENIIQTNFGLAAKYQWILSAEQVNGLSFDSISQIFGTIAQRTDLTSGLSRRVVTDMAIMLDQRGQVNGQLGYWVWTLSDQQIQGLSKDAGLALFKAWVSHDWLDETYSPNHVVNDTLARQVKNFSSDVVDTIIKDFGLAARYQWLLSAEQVNELAPSSIKAIDQTIKSKFSYGELSKNVWNVLGVTAEPAHVEQHINDVLWHQPTINAELLIQRMASAANEPSANTNVFNPNAPLGASSSNQALVAVH